ncbi:hypothetical protein P9112_009103 [Eukaryota sp. TZLM1-RC]
MIDPSLLSRWQSQGLLGVDCTDADVMVFLLKRTQFTSYHEACTALMKPRINWRKIHNKHEADNEFGRYVEDFGDVLRMTTYMTDLTIPDLIRGSSELITISPALIAEYFLMGLDNFAISSELLPPRLHQNEQDDQVESQEEPLNTNTSLKSMNEKGQNSIHSAATSKVTILLATLYSNAKDPRCAGSRVPREERFRLGEQEAPPSRGSVERGRGGRGRRVHRFKFRGRGGRFRGHKGRGQYRPVYNINTTEDISSNASPTESKPTRSSTVPHRRINNSNRNSRTGNLPNRVHINAINHDQSTTDLGNPVNNFPTAQQNLLIPLQIHQTSSDINSIFDINSTVSENHIRSQRSPFLRLEISINDIKMIATIDSAAFCSVITADLAEQ